jgi:hypothetical protein
MLSVAPQNNDKLVVTIDVLQAADDKHALHDADVFRTQFGATEQPN